MWLKTRNYQEKPQPLVEMKVFDRNNKHFEYMAKVEYPKKMKEAQDEERPKMKMGKRQVEAANKVDKPKEESLIEIVSFAREKPAVFKETKKQKNVETIFGAPMGPPPKKKCVRIADDLFEYMNSLSKQER